MCAVYFLHLTQGGSTCSLLSTVIIRWQHMQSTFYIDLKVAAHAVYFLH